jgi:hypothetical protein
MGGLGHDLSLKISFQGRVPAPANSYFYLQEIGAGTALAPTNAVLPLLKTFFSSVGSATRQTASTPSAACCVGVAIGAARRRARHGARVHP